MISFSSTKTRTYRTISMTSTERAKSFLGKRLKQTALLILPLAAAAVQARADVTFSLTSGFFIASGSATPSVITPFSSTPLNNGVNGISLSGDALFTAEPGSGGGSGNGGLAGCGAVCAGFFAFGGVDGTFNSDSLL